jgi:MSHA biogenesis protein MshN
MTAFIERAGLLCDNDNRIVSIRYHGRLTVIMVFMLLLTPAVGWPESIPPDRGEFLESFAKPGQQPVQSVVVSQTSVAVLDSDSQDHEATPVAQPGASSVGKSEPDYRDVIERQTPTDNEVRIARSLSLRQVDKEVSLEAVRFIQQGQYDKAKEGLMDFLAENPDGHLSRQTLATILMTRNENEAAKQLLEEGLQRTPDLSAFKKLLARILQDTDTTRAIALLKQRPPHLEDDTEYHELLAALLQLQGDYLEAQVLYEALTLMNPSNGRWWMGLGIALDAKGEKQKALAAFQRALKFPTSEARVRHYSQERIIKLRELL